MEKNAKRGQAVQREKNNIYDRECLHSCVAHSEEICDAEVLPTMQNIISSLEENKFQC